MVKRLFVRPAEGLQVRFPGTNDILPAEGKHVPDDKYWRRRLAAKDVIEAAPPVAE